MVETDTQSAAALIGRPVADPHGIGLGLIGDVLADRSLANVLGFEVETPRGSTFLPFAACSIDAGETTVASALSLLGPEELAYYQARSVSLVDLRGRAAGADFLLDMHGRIAAVMLQPQQSPTVGVQVSNGAASGRRRQTRVA